MSSIAIQTAVGKIGEKAVTELTYGFSSLININGFQFGGNESGLFRLNTEETDNGTKYTRSVTFATIDFGISNPKHGRFIDIGFEATATLVLFVKIDNQAWRNYTVTPLKTGLQRIRIPIGRNGQGRYFTFKLSSNSRFRLDQIDGVFIVRPAGIKGY